MATITAEQYTSRQTEADFQKAVMELAELRGWWCVHWPNARFNPIWPDLTCYRGGVCRHLELKTVRGRLGPKQREVCGRLFDQGFPVLVANPNQWDEIEEWLR